VSVIELSLMLKIISAILAVVLFLSSVLGLFFLFAYVGDSAARVRREHGLTTGVSMKTYRCTSSTGNSLTVQIWPIVGNTSA
jgi:hypothetical protein